MLDAGGSIASIGKTVGEDLLSSARLDIFPMPHTCKAFGILEEPSILTALRLRYEELGITPEKLDEMSKKPAPLCELRKALNLE